MTVDAAPLLGTWTNTNAQTTGCTRVRITLEDHGLMLEARRGALVGRGLATPHAQRPEGGPAVAVSAGARADAALWSFEGNINQGLLVLGCYQSAPDVGHAFSREYFTPQPSPTPEQDGDDLLFLPAVIPEQPSVDKYVGVWRDAAGPGTITIQQQGEGLTVDVDGTDHPVFLYANVAYGHVAGAALRVHTETDTLQLREVKGVLVVAAFHGANGPGVTATFDRQFFYRT